MNEPNESQVERALKVLPRAGRGYEAAVPNPKAKLLDQVKEAMRLEANIERSTSNVQQRTANIEPPTSNARVRGSTLDVGR